MVVVAKLTAGVCMMLTEFPTGHLGGAEDLSSALASLLDIIIDEGRLHNRLHGSQPRALMLFMAMQLRLNKCAALVCWPSKSGIAIQAMG